MLCYARILAAVFFLFSLAVGAKAALEPDRGLLDFGAFYMAGVVQEKGVDDPYAVYPELAEETGANFGYTDGRGHSPNLNPPISLYAFRPLADLNPADTKVAFQVASAFVFVACALAMLKAYPEHRTPQGVLWIASFGGLWYTLWLGQIYMLPFALGLGAWFLIQRGTNPLLAGLLIGLLVAIKPHFAIWPLLLLLAGHPRIGLSAFASAAAVSAVPLVLQGPEIYQQWLEAVQAYPRIALGFNASLIGEAERLGVPALGYALSVTLVVSACFVMWWSRATAVRASSWGIVVALLAAPITWIGYGLLAMPVLLSRRWGALEWIAALGMTSLWFVLERGELALAASLVLMFLLARDQFVRQEVAHAVEEARSLSAQRQQVAASTRLGVVVGEVGSRTMDWEGGLTAEAYSRDLQPSANADAANSMGWDCRVHVEYEGQPAVDWYIPVGTPVRSTLDGRATMYVVSLPNAFDYYDVSREPYIGNPDRDRAPLSPFPGPGGGKGVFIEVTNDAFATEYGHLNLEMTLPAVPEGAYLDGFSQAYDYATAFGTMRAFNDYIAIASWDVRAGDVIGYSGDSGYSEAPHLHYTVRRASTSNLLCPTTEAGFEDEGWLFR